MTFSNYLNTRLLVLIIGISQGGLLLGQSLDDWKFINEAHRSIKNQPPFNTTKDTVLFAYLTFHPVSVSNDTVSMFASATFRHREEKAVVKTGQIFKVPPGLLPAEPLQLLIVPIFFYLNPWHLKKNYEFREKFPTHELEDYKACGYMVREPAQIRIGRPQY